MIAETEAFSRPGGLLDLSSEQLQEAVVRWGEPPYRARQVEAWLYRRGVWDPEQMTDLPLGLRQRLAPLGGLGLELRRAQRSGDGTVKYLFGLWDGEAVETVAIPEGERLTLCISSQAGCPMACAFCATGLLGLHRNLRAGEIVAQVLAVQAELGRRVSNVVFMGMGEPLANLGPVLQAIARLNGARDGLGLGARRITVSTCGVVPGIRRLAGLGLQVGLAVSLHAPDDELRSRLVPLNARYPIASVLEATDEYIAATGRRVSFEYVLLAGVNDSLEHARALAKLLAGRLAHVNLIPYNPVRGLPFQAPQDPDHILRFARTVESFGVPATVRRNRGSDIDAACGQLRAQEDP